MGTYKRINVSLGRPLKLLANYSRALRCGDMVLQSGTTAIDTNGDIIGENDIATQVDAIVDIAPDTMRQARGSLEDVVHSRASTSPMLIWRTTRCGPSADISGTSGPR